MSHRIYRKVIKCKGDLESCRCSVLNHFIHGISPVEVVDGMPLLMHKFALTDEKQIM